MVDRAQLLKGLLEGCILEIIQREETYGYKITSDLNDSGFKDLNEGSVYPVLIRLEKKGYIVSESKKSPLGPKRKYFTITDEGRGFLKSFKAVWKDISKVVDNIMKGGDLCE
ncbi:transcriptional regulator, PadR family [Dethiosulfatibacter aminovorans DSM 17477]|uniref:Transcriptional regulator, PadR family n=1 Tax=Dethiosulfatibacter aminovorans DSM 17477 TaxID=1121476 RepID=A0A1M6BMS2_9FIRM|nr:PadR family transcriptional regulator [Dethiosulfatibacter aminovorans]SHI50039.1 transcriptional regulator, PadR family [Dethiosulfatibacter aminovorans DSM 17477]